ncbi:MAG: hypothetical protein HY713_11350 [candidate division NC10 bacterium]|nr:hypothetical protein [candidate division NC10 bacterium]
MGGRWFGRHGPSDAEGLQALRTRICRQETALACHLAERARALRFAPHWPSLEGVAERDRQNAQALAREIGCETTLAGSASPARRPGTLTATKLIRDLEEIEDLYALYRQASRLTADFGRDPQRQVGGAGRRGGARLADHPRDPGQDG